MTPSGVEPATFQFVVQFLNQLYMTKTECEMGRSKFRISFPRVSFILKELFPTPPVTCSKLQYSIICGNLRPLTYRESGFGFRLNYLRH
jgi:hypothetical protein